MVGYIKRMSDFSTEQTVVLTYYTLPIDSESSGSVKVVGELPDTMVGQWLVFDGLIWLIESVSPKDGITTVKVSEPVSVFDRDMVYSTPTGVSTIGGLISLTIANEWINQTDSIYQLSYISVTNTDTTALVEPAVEDDGLWNLTEYIRTARASGVDIHFTMSGASSLAIAISTRNATTRNVVFGAGHWWLDSKSFSRDVTAKVTVHQTDADTTYYLASDGTISTAVPASRASGRWETIHASDDDDPLEKATEVFDDNEQTHKIIFYSDAEYNLYDVISFRFEDGTLFTAKLTGIQIQSTDNRRKYTCGDLPTTLTEQLEALRKKEESNGN